MIVHKNIFVPLYYFLLLWLFFIIFFNIGVINWPDLHENTVYYLFGFIITICITYLIMAIFFNRLVRKNYLDEQMRHVDRMYNIILILCIIYIFLVIGNNFSILSSEEFSLNNLTELRYARMQDNESSFLNILSIIISGFPVIFYIFSYRYMDYLSRLKRVVSFCVFSVYLFSTILSGGRNGFFIGILILFFTFLYKNMIFKHQKKKVSLKLVSYIFLIILFFIVIVSIIFIDRMEFRGRNFTESFEYLEYWYCIHFNTFLLDLLGNEYIGKIILYLCIYIFIFFIH